MENEIKRMREAEYVEAVNSNQTDPDVRYADLAEILNSALGAVVHECTGDESVFADIDDSRLSWDGGKVRLDGNQVICDDGTYIMIIE